MSGPSFDVKSSIPRSTFDHQFLFPGHDERVPPGLLGPKNLSALLARLTYLAVVRLWDGGPIPAQATWAMREFCLTAMINFSPLVMGRRLDGTNGFPGDCGSDKRHPRAGPDDTPDQG